MEMFFQGFTVWTFLADHIHMFHTQIVSVFKEVIQFYILHEASCPTLQDTHYISYVL